jgi:hypothetical protein
MSESDPTPEAIDDDQLPADLRPDDNPLAEGLEPGETVDDLLTGGKHAEQDPSGATPDEGDGAS